MADLNQPSDIKAYFRDTIVANHTEIKHFCNGHINNLVKLFKDIAKEGEYVLYLEWPQKRYRDNDGSIEAKLRPKLSILRAMNKEDYEAQDTAIDKCMEILNDVIIRMRSEVFYDGFLFSINDLSVVDPVYHYMIENCVGCRVEIPLGDWVSLTKDVSKWTDLS